MNFTTLRQWFFPSRARETAALQAARSSTPPVFAAPDALTQRVASFMSHLPLPARQFAMLQLYDENFYVEHLINRIINPLLGKTGFLPLAQPNCPATQDILDEFWELNGLTDLAEQERIVRDYLLVGEVFDLVAPASGSFLTAPLLPVVIDQTVTDPLNYHKLIGVKQDIGVGAWRYHPLVADERVFSPAAQTLRGAWRMQGGFDCFSLQNLKRTAPVSGNGVAAHELYQKRGEPYLYSSSDLFKMLVSYLWTSLDRAQALNTFNWGFGVKFSEKVKDKAAELARWKQIVGQPKPNSAFFYPADEMTVAPFSFPAGVASAIEGLFKLMRNTAGWTASSRDEDMGDADSRFASMKQPGVTNPTVETLVALQTKVQAYHQKRAEYVLQKTAQAGQLPADEFELVRGRPRFRYTISSPEISKQDFGVAATTFNAFEQGWLVVAGRGVYTPESVVKGEQRMALELFGIDLEVADAAKAAPSVAAEVV